MKPFPQGQFDFGLSNIQKQCAETMMWAFPTDKLQHLLILSHFRSIRAPKRCVVVGKPDPRRPGFMTFLRAGWPSASSQISSQTRIEKNADTAIRMIQGIFIMTDRSAVSVAKMFVGAFALALLM